MDLLVDGSKTWEIRDRPTRKRGRVMLAAAGTGLILGEVSIIGCRRLQRSNFSDHSTFHRVEDAGLVDGYSEIWAWIVADAKRYARPVPYQHPQGAVVFIKQGLPTLVAWH